MFEQTALCALPSFKFGHATNLQAGTGCSVIVAPKGAICGVDVRGGGPATRETDLLKPENMIELVHAIMLSGGSAFGLEASSGAMDALCERHIGLEVETVRVPIVVGACLFDLLVGKNIHPDKAMGRAAIEAAFSDEPLAEGNVGAGTGASVGKLLGGNRAMKSGFGVHVVRFGSLVVAALVAVNALGNVRGEDGTWIAGCLDDHGKVLDGLEAFSAAAHAQHAASGDQEATTTGPCSNTTLGVIVTNASITKAQATKVSQVAHDAYARAIKPVHTSNDGDTVFTFSSGEVQAPVDLVAVMGTEAMQQAIYRGVCEAKMAFGLPSAQDITRD